MSEGTLSGFTLDELFADPKRETEGVWVDFYNGSKLKLASTESPVYQARLAKLAKKHQLQLDADNEESIHLVQEITAEAMSHCVLLDWKGINMHGQENIPYTPKLGKEALLKSSKFRKFVTESAGDHENFRAEVAEKVKKS